VMMVIGFATAMMFWQKDPKRLDKRVHELS
jgi:hypothetical protein